MPVVMFIYITSNTLTASSQTQQILAMSAAGHNIKSQL